MEKNLGFRTYYDNKNYVDESIHFDPNSSLTDQDYKMQTEIDYLLSHMAGQSRTPLYGVQDNMTFEDWSNEMALLKRRFLHLDEETRQAFGNAQNFLKWCADPENYVEQLPTIVNEKKLKLKQEQDLKDFEEKEEKRAKRLAKAIKE